MAEKRIKTETLAARFTPAEAAAVRDYLHFVEVGITKFIRDALLSEARDLGFVPEDYTYMNAAHKD
jgi:hypothetical protein